MIEVFLLVPRMNVRERAADLDVKLRQSHAPARVLTSGTMHKHHAGFILLEWFNDVPDSFLQYLDSSNTFYGYAVYPATRFPTATLGK